MTVCISGDKGFRDLVESNNSDCDLCVCFCQYALCSCQTCCWWFFPDVGHKNFHSIDVGAASSNLWNQVTSSGNFGIQNSVDFLLWKLRQVGCYDVAKFWFVSSSQLWVDPIPTGHGRNQPIYESHMTTASRNRDNAQLSIVTNLNFAAS